MPRLPAALLGLLIFASSACAWDAGGHEIVATIAYAHLNPQARAAAIRDYAALAGALILARGVARQDPDLAEEILLAAIGG